MYAGHTRGLEESGVAPSDVANRNQALPAIRTRQTDAGLRWTLGPMKLVAGVFDVRKPYFTTDERNVFTTLGDVQHRGIEMSLSGKPVPALSVVAGAVLMRPRVTGAPVREGRIGDRPVGQTDRLLRADLDYRPSQLPQWSFDLATTYTGDRVSSRDNRAEVPAYTLVDLGARYRFEIGRSKATLRLQVANVGGRLHLEHLRQQQLWPNRRTSVPDAARRRYSLVLKAIDNYPGNPARVLANDGHFVSIKATILEVPEPSTYALAIMSMVSLGRRHSSSSSCLNDISLDPSRPAPFLLMGPAFFLRFEECSARTLASPCARAPVCAF